MSLVKFLFFIHPRSKSNVIISAGRFSLTAVRINDHISVNNVHFPKYYSAKSEKSNGENSNEKMGTEMDVSRKNPYAHLTPAQKVVEASKDVTYTGVIIFGLGLIGYVFYTLGQELFSTSSSTGIYSEAFKRCKEDSRVVSAMGDPIKAYGETSRRGRRQHVSSEEFFEKGEKHVRMKFYIESPHRKATVYVETKEGSSKQNEYVYLIVELAGFPSKTIVIEDRR